MGAEDNERVDRLIEATVALLQSAPGQRMQVTNLNKALFYLDLAALRDTGKTVTEHVYVALQQGPVLDGYKDRLIPTLVERGLARQDEDGMGRPVVLTRPKESYFYLDDHLRGLAAKIARFVSGETAKKISDISHGNPGWTIAYNKGSGRNMAPAPINMLIAMQQLGTDDPWINEDPDEDLVGLFRDSELHDGVEW